MRRTEAGHDLVDLQLAARLAAKLSASDPLERSYLLNDLESDFVSLTAEAEPHVAEETGFQPATPAVPIVMSRREWARANIGPLIELIDPLLHRMDEKMQSAPLGAFARSAYRSALGAQMGIVLGFISHRVLGQYDVTSTAGNEIWFVGTNVVATERRLGASPRDFRLWITLHELTHRAQFEGLSWMRDYFLSSVDELMGSIHLDPRSLLERIGEMVRSGNEGPLAFLDESQRESFFKLQAFMSVVEGHGNFVMDRVAQRTIPSHARLRRAFVARGAAGGPLAKIVRRIFGLDLKRMQYEEGQKFFELVFERSGRKGVDLALSSPETLPSGEEIRDPAGWLLRMGI